MTETDCGISMSGASVFVADVDDPAKKPPGSERRATSPAKELSTAAVLRFCRIL